MSPCNNQCTRVLTINHRSKQAILPDVSFPLYFCLGPVNNILINLGTHSIRVFSPDTHDRKGQQLMNYQPQGIEITPNERFVSVSENEKYSLQIFC